MTNKRMTFKHYRQELCKLHMTAKELMNGAPNIAAENDAERIVFSIDHARRMATHEIAANKERVS